MESSREPWLTSPGLRNHKLILKKDRPNGLRLAMRFEQ